MTLQEVRKFRHDIRGSLNSIELSTEVIRSAQDQSEIEEFLKYISVEVAKIGQAVDGLVHDVSASNFAPGRQ